MAAFIVPNWHLDWVNISTHFCLDIYNLIQMPRYIRMFSNDSCMSMSKSSSENTFSFSAVSMDFFLSMINKYDLATLIFSSTTTSTATGHTNSNNDFVYVVAPYSSTMMMTTMSEEDELLEDSASTTTSIYKRQEYL